AFEIALLPPISRGTHLAGPQLHAERLVKLWRTDEAVPLAQATRLLEVSAVEGAIWQTMMAIGEFGNSRYWQFPELEQLLPPLRDLTWQEILAGRLTVEATPVKGTRHRVVSPGELQDGLEPDWQWSRLLRGGRGVFADVLVSDKPPAPTQKRWQEQPSP